MKQEDEICALSGYRWRDELVDELLRYVREGVDRRCLNNVVRKYVPVFTPPKLGPTEKPGRWIYPRSYESIGYYWENEIQVIGKEFAERYNQYDHQLSKDKFKNVKLASSILKNHLWEVEKDVCGVSEFDPKGRWQYDAYKELDKGKIAVEIELSDRYHIFKDVFKFLIGQAMGQIDMGIIIVWQEMRREGQPHYEIAEIYADIIFSILPMIDFGFYGLLV